MSILREVIPRWRLVLLVALLAVVASAVAVSQREPSYTATARLLITPVAQYDETFLGTSLIRDPGDANRTAPTAAEMLSSTEIGIESARRLGGEWTAESVREAVDVKPVANTNLLAIRARAGEGAFAERLAAVYAASAFAVRWRTITRELGDRIAALEARPGRRRDAGGLARKIGILEATRRDGRDPTLRLLGVNDAVADNQVPGLVVGVLALLGGLFLGGLAAVGIGQIGQRVRHEDVPSSYPLPVLARVSPNGGDRLHRVAVQIERGAPEGGTIAVASLSNATDRATVAAEIAAAVTESGRTATVIAVTPDAEAQPVRELLAEARLLADFVVVNCPPPHHDLRGLETATLADFVLLVVRAEVIERQGLESALELLELNGIAPAGLILLEPGHDWPPGASGSRTVEKRPRDPPHVIAHRS